MKLRPYQQEAVAAIRREFSSVDSTLLVLPTGTGKTIVFADVIRRAFPRRALVLAHREELIFQAAEKIHRVTGFRCDVEMAGYRADMDGLLGGPQVVVSTIQTQTAGADGSGRMSRFDPAMFGLLVVDEGHHSTAKSYRRCLDYYRQNPALKVLGVTATPDRADEEALGQVYESVAYDYEILDAIHDGWLAPIEQQMVTVSGLDYSHVRTTAGDLNGADLAAVMEEEQALQGIAAPTLELTQGRRTLVFASSVAHAERLAEIFNRHKDSCAAWVCGKTDKEERRKTLSAFAAGAIQYVVNVGVLTEGFDDPGVECIVMGRPTKSRSLYAQMIGRATRPLPGLVEGLEDAAERRAAIAGSPKPGCLVVDFVGNAGRHKLMTTADILGGKASDEAVAEAVAKAKASGKPVRMDEAIDLAETELADRRRQAAQRARLRARARWTSAAVSPFDVFALTPARERGWDSGRSLTDKQRALLDRQGIDPGALTYTQGRQLLTEIFRRWDAGLCSYKQARVLRRNGYDGNVSREEASKILDGIFGGRKHGNPNAMAAHEPLPAVP
ncbi:MAG: DEAD/DEAH box helicase, partial [Planctomycetes bacterium]|nr:DEAD/DEAH box helicase [Planctomycetota bacterium]